LWIQPILGAAHTIALMRQGFFRNQSNNLILIS